MGPGVAQPSSRLEARRLFGETCNALQDAETNRGVVRARARCGRRSPEVLTRLQGSLTLQSQW